MLKTKITSSTSWGVAQVSHFMANLFRTDPEESVVVSARLGGPGGPGGPNKEEYPRPSTT